MQDSVLHNTRTYHADVKRRILRLWLYSLFSIGFRIRILLSEETTGRYQRVPSTNFVIWTDGQCHVFHLDRSRAVELIFIYLRMLSSNYLRYHRRFCVLLLVRAIVYLRSVTKMKFVFGFILLVSALVAISPQQFHQQRTGQQWLSQYHQLPRTFLYNQRQPAASLYYEPVDANIPFFRYSRPNIQPALIYPQNEEGSYQGAFDGIPQYYIDNKQSVQQKNQDLLLKQVGQDNEEKKAFTVFPYVRPIAPSAVYSQADGDESIIELLASQNLFADGPSKVGYSRPKLGFQNEDDKLGKIIPVMAQQHMTNQNQMANVKPRIKNFGFYQGLSAGNQQQNARLFYLDGSNLLSKTLTVKVTSTCTTISIVSCIQITNLDPSDPPVPCRRKRSPEVDHALEKDESQFPINPSKVEIVTPTLEPFLSILPHDLIQTPPVEMASSKEETLHNNDESNSLVTYMAKQQREEKAFKFNIQNFLTYTTVTILGSIVTSTLTQTFVPAAALACLPAGYVLCPL